MTHRIKKLNSKSNNSKGKFVVYVMEASQRVYFNHALEFAISIANEYKKPLVVIFNLTDKFKFSNLRYYHFMIEGLLKLKHQFKERKINFFILRNDYVTGTIELSKNAFAIVTDKNYLKTQRIWRKRVSEMIDVPIFEVESDVVVPIEIASNKKEPYAATIRPKILNILNEFLEPVTHLNLKTGTIELEFDSFNNYTLSDILDKLNIDKSINPVSEYFQGGYDKALELLNVFIHKKLHQYKENRNDPTKDFQSELSPYLHFGQISIIQILLEILKYYDLEDENVQTFINEAVVWRELARNFCYYNQFYNQFDGIPDWAKKTLLAHANDSREYIYTLDELENAKTHDTYWNAAQIQLLKTGKMHNYMRMYWAKKLIEWTNHPRTAFDYACFLNDKYELDGRDPNGYAGISWCFGTHDRPWFERKIFGKIRYMNDKGLERKFDIKKYVEKYSSI